MAAVRFDAIAVLLVLRLGLTEELCAFAPQQTNPKPWTLKGAACTYDEARMSESSLHVHKALEVSDWLQAARFAEESNHQRKVQLFFTIILTLLEHQLLTVKQKCTPAALAADPKIDVEAMFRCITNAVKVRHAPVNSKVSCWLKQ